MHSSRMRCADPSTDSVYATCHGVTRKRASLTRRLAALALLATTAAVLPACSSGGGGDNGANPPAGEIDVQGLNFTYPFDGQLDVVLDSQIVINFPGKLSGAGESALTLQDTDGNAVGPDVTVQTDDDQDNIVRLMADGDLEPNTDYQVVANSNIAGGGARFSSGDVLFSFRTRPLEGRPAAGDFAITSLSPGEQNDLTPNRSSKFTEFNAIRVVLNEPVDPATVNDASFMVTGPDGNQVTTGSNGNAVDARLTASGRYIVFDPVEDLAPGEYTIKYTDAITSVFGKALTAGTIKRTVLDVGEDTTDQLLVIEERSSNSDVEALPDDFLGGGKTNNVNIVSQLIGSNDQPVVGPEDVSTSIPPIRNRVKTTLATPGQPGFGDVFPAVIRGGQRFQLTNLTLALGGGIPTPVISGPIDVNFPNDVDVYLQSNDYRNIETPTAVRLRLDLSIGTLITATAGTQAQQYIIQQLANGVFNQSVLNIQAAGLAIPRDNGDLEISTLGTFPINVNRTDNATVDFGLTLILPAKTIQEDAPVDNIAPFVTAQSPSACLYAFGSPGYDAFYTGAAPTAFPEVFCAGPLNGNPPPNGGLGVSVNSFPIESSPSVTFSSPIDPATVNANSVRLASSSGVVPATFRVEGFSVVIDPNELLQPNTGYQITLNGGSMLTDLAGNAVTFNNLLGPTPETLAFRTEPQVESNPAPALLGALTPGIPCSLDGGDFMGGGNNAGNCANNTDNGTAPDYPVFTSPVDVPVDGIFSKYVNTDSVVLANGCLTAGSGDANDVPSASIALQEMNGSGQCVGTPDAELAFAGDRNDVQTRAFTIRPVEALKSDSRYWVVVCGADGTDCVNNGGTITDVDGLTLNTTPLVSTGSTPASPAEPAAGGPDILMPFDTVAANKDYYTNQFTLPETDTNGNGQFDDANGDEMFQDGEERPQPGNRSLVSLSLSGSPILNGNRDDGKFASYLALARPIALRQITDQCDRVGVITFDDGTSAVGGDVDSCIPASLLPGGINSLTGIGIGTFEALGGLAGVLGPLNEAADGTPIEDIPVLGDILTGVFDTAQDAAGAIGTAVGGFLAEAVPINMDNLNTGRILLRFPNDENPDATRVTQTGYIVEKCEGTFPAQTADDGTVIKPAVDYDFEPCFTASLNLVANAPDGQGVALDQQSFIANIVGPVTFEQNGRLVISVRNANTITLDATALGLLPATATIAPADLNFQLVGNATHGGRAFPNR